MSRIAKLPIEIPVGVNVHVAGQIVSISGPKGELSHRTHPAVETIYRDDLLRCVARTEEPSAVAQAGTARALLQNMITGVTAGFQRKLQLVGVGYRSQMQGSTLNLVLGYSYPVGYVVPQDISIETPTQTEVVVKGIDKQRVGQIAAEIRSLRPPEPYKGKGIRYQNEAVASKEVKKK